MERHQVVIDPQKCVGCGLCAKVCVAHNLTIEQKKAKTVLDGCILCGQCTAVCPQKAIVLSGCGAPQAEQPAGLRLEPEKVLDVIRFRRSVRQFQQREISEGVIGQILEAGRLTHTAKNAQDVSYVVLQREKDRAEALAVHLFRKLKPWADLFSPLAKNNRIDEHFFFFGAPAVIVVLAKDKTNGLLAAQNMEFVAEANGLGVLFSGYFTMAVNASRSLRKALRVPKGKRAAMTLVLGYPAVKFLRGTPHRPLDAIYL